MTITNNIKFYRKGKKLTQKVLAQKTNISERQIIKIEAGEEDPKTSNSIKIAKALDTTVEELFPVAPDNSSLLQKV